MGKRESKKDVKHSDLHEVEDGKQKKIPESFVSLHFTKGSSRIAPDKILRTDEQTLGQIVSSIPPTTL